VSAWPLEELLWESRRAVVDGGAGEPVPADETLHAYREGGLSDIGRRRLEWTLCRSAAARARLCEIAGVKLARPSGRLRRAILGTPRAIPKAIASHWPMAAAVLLAGAMVSAAILLEFPRVAPEATALPPDLAFDVRVEGLAETRSGSGIAQALPRTPVRITIEPRAFGVDGLEFALYVPRQGHLRRLDAGDDLRVESSRGAARLVASAHALAGSVIGPHEFYVVVSRRGVLRQELDVDAAIAASRSGEALVYRQTIEIVEPDDPGTHSGGEP
jgi:hypothetical protein